MIQIKEKIALAPLTSFRLGGEVSFYAEVSSLEELKEALAFAKEKNMDFYVLGGGTNLLVSDKGFNGLIVRMKLNEIKVDGNILEAGAGVPLIKAVNESALAGLSGLEPLAGIPGTVGGAVRGNAGAFGAEIGAHIKSVKFFDAASGEVGELDKEACDFSYRCSHFKKNKNLIVLSAAVALEKAEPEAAKEKIKETIAKRTSRGLHGVKSAGSYFMNPLVTDARLLEQFEKEKGVQARGGVVPAGWVIEQAGLRGKKIGGAAVSEEHANYIINTGDATAEDVIMLVSYVKQQVRDQLGIQLTEEVNYLGF